MTEAAIQAVVIGASAGAVQALLTLLPALPSSYALPVLVVVHVPSDRSNVLVPLLQAKCQVQVKEAEDKEPVAGGVVYFAPSDYHLLVEADGALALSSDEMVNYSRPSIDVLFESAADAYGPALVGVILTGANHDGAAGLRAVVDAGGVAVVEDPDSAYASAMPHAALEACPSATTMNLNAIALYLSSLGGRPMSAEKPINFLLVDDLDENLLALEALLQREGLTCLKARSGEEALELLLMHDVALALLDVQMPDMNGFELAEFMRGNARTSHVPIIFVTAGTADNQRRFRGYEAGAVDFIQKPIEADVLRSKANVFFDLHKQRQQIELQRDELEAAAQALRRADRHKDSFLAVLAHELRNPVAALSGGLHLLGKDVSPERAQDIRTRMDRMLTHLSHLVDDLLDVSRVSQGKISLKKERIELGEILRSAIEASQHNIDAGRHHLITETPGEAIWFEADHTRLTQVVANLLNNAAKYTPAGGTITLSATRLEGVVEIKVSDTGSGHPRRHAIADLRDFRPGRGSPDQGARRAGHRAGAGQATRHAARRHDRGGERGSWHGQQLHGQAADPRLIVA